jgi:hypothetical protein
MRALPKLPTRDGVTSRAIAFNATCTDIVPTRIRSRGTLWDDNFPHVTVTFVTSSIQARRGQRTPSCSRMQP